MWKFKEELTTENEQFLDWNRAIYQEYKKQPLRTHCKICGGDVKRWTFHSHDVEYYCCDTCGHINGNHIDTEEFCRKLYEQTDSNYGTYYTDSDNKRYRSRVDAIYMPKAKFLKELLEDIHYDINRMFFLDVGAGAGHFVSALQELGLNAEGVEVDASSVKYAEQVFNDNSIKHCDSENMCHYLRSTNADVITFIYCLEHITNVMECLDAVHDNKNVKFIYFSVPMFSYSAIIESVFKDIYARVLGAAHTHIFTEESISWLCEKYQWEVVGNWRFGADVADFLRSISVYLKKQNDEKLAEIFKEKLTDIMDELQLVMDKSGFCSDIHILMKKKS